MGGGGGLAPLLVADRIFFSLFSLSILFHFLVFHLINLFIFVVRTQVWLLAHCQPQFGTFVPKKCPELQAPSPAKHGKERSPDCGPCLLSAPWFNHSAAT